MEHILSLIDQWRSKLVWLRIKPRRGSDWTNLQAPDEEKSYFRLSDGVLRPPSKSFFNIFSKLESFSLGLGQRRKEWISQFAETRGKNLSLLTHIKSFDSWL